MPAPIREVEASSEQPHFQWDNAELSRLFQVLESHPLSKAMPRGILSIAFIGNERSQELHGQFFDDPTPTDVMTFPGDSEEDHAGDIAANIEIAQAEAPAAQWAASEELTLYLIHGWLHLAGFRDHDAPSIEAMRAAESQLFASVREHDALPHFCFPRNKTEK